MPNTLPSEIWRLGDSVTPTEKLLLLALVDYGVRIHPSQGTLAVKTGLSVRTVGDAIASLRRKGLVTTDQRGSKSLSYSVILKRPTSANSADLGRQPLPRRSANSAEVVGNYCRGILTSQGTSQSNPLPADAGRGVESPWDGIDPEDERRIRRWCGRHDPEELCAAQRRVTLRTLGDLRLRVTDHGRWWTRLGAIWAESGVPPYQTLKAELDAIGADVRDKTAVLAFRLGIGKVAA